ncbi:MAG: polysaccharide pyruvyl transferase family protein [Candidatus Saccharibacteria bacterium]|nr:MAG: polysaccharide pyruvyl transferase family protein [Candidatus Saccharibacteria bacterium]
MPKISRLGLKRLLLHPNLAYRKIGNRKKAPLKVYWWRYQYPKKLNFGDEITPYLIEYIWGRKCVWTDVPTCELAGAGSIIGVLQTESKGNVIKVWGSGFIEEGDDNDCSNLDFYAVRGPLSRQRVKADRKIALGDPGLLSNLAFEPSRQKKYKVGIVAHYVDKESPFLDKIKNDPTYLLIDPLQTPAKVAKDITSCELVLSSSLHGLIVADSFAVPNFWMPLSDNLTGGSYKFNDYYMSTERELVSVKPDILGDNSAITTAIQSYVPVRRLRRLQRALIKSFPY